MLPQFKNPSLRLRALTHRSFLNENAAVTEDNERLEYLGDAVLDLIVAELLYHRLPEMKEGRLTRLRSALVRTEQLAAFARALNLGQQLRIGKGEEDNGGRTRDSMLCDTFEAIIGAYYLDSGMEAVNAFVRPLLQPVLENLLNDEGDGDSKSQLQEWSQAEHKFTPQYIITGAHGPDHQRTFTAQVIIQGQVMGEGTGRNKRAAEQTAALDALKKLGLA
jgi:ribonuclease-3